jgi:hypothetical protein
VPLAGGIEHLGSVAFSVLNVLNAVQGSTQELADFAWRSESGSRRRSSPIEPKEIERAGNSLAVEAAMLLFRRD